MAEYIVYGVAEYRVSAIVAEADNKEEALNLAKKGDFNSVDPLELVGWEFDEVERNE